MSRGIGATQNKHLSKIDVTLCLQTAEHFKPLRRKVVERPKDRRAGIGYSVGQFAIDQDSRGYSANRVIPCAIEHLVRWLRRR